MKCPNCSFVNPDENKTCRVCGFDLIPIDVEDVIKPVDNNPPITPYVPHVLNGFTDSPVSSETKLSKRRIIDDSEDEALDSAFNSIFEPERNEHYHFDKTSKSENHASKLGAKSSIPGANTPNPEAKSSNPEANTSNPGDTSNPEVHTLKSLHDVNAMADDEIVEADEAHLDEEDSEDESRQPFSKKKVILMILLVVVLFLLLGLKFLWPGLPWKYVSTSETTETQEVTSTEVENTTEAAFTLGDETSILPINDFYNLLPEFINRGNLSILSLFENSQDALEVLTSFAVIGNLEKITEASVLESEVSEESATYKVGTLTNRLINGQQTQTASIWDFRVVFKNDTWLLETMAVETGPIDATEPTSPENTQVTTEVTTEQTTEPTKETTAEPTTEKTTTETTTEATTEKATTLLKGFKSNGSFTGGEKSNGQDVAFSRYGSHDTFERLAFDLYEWIGGKPTQPVDVVTNYTAGISDDGRTISIIINGAIEAYASQMQLDLTNSANIESVSYNYFGNDEAVAITISLKQPCQYKVFNLVSPAKIVVDIAPIE